MDSYIYSLGWDLDPIFMRRDPGPTIQCIERLAKGGARWQPKEDYKYRSFRKALYRTEKWKALDILDKLLGAEVSGDGVFRKLMSTPKMKDLLSHGYGNADRLRKAAGLIESRSGSKSRAANFIREPKEVLEMVWGLLRLWTVVWCGLSPTHGVSGTSSLRSRQCLATIFISGIEKDSANPTQRWHGSDAELLNRDVSLKMCAAKLREPNPRLFSRARSS
jgi:hypothetical protein